MKGRKLLCKNDLIDSFKKNKPLELKVFYNMLYCYKEQINYKPGLQDEEETYLELNKLVGYLGKKHLSEKELTDLIINIPKGIYSKDKKVYVAVFEFIKLNEYKEITYKITDSFKPYIDDIVNNFTVLELKGMANLGSSYSLRMFEFISKNKNIKQYKMPIKKFREYFQIPNSYKISNIDQQVIKPSVKDINTKTNFKINISKIKKSNRVTHIYFKFKEEK